MGYTSNMERLIASQNQQGSFMADFAKMQKKTFEINARHPLIEALLDKTEQLDGAEDGPEADALKEGVQVLWATSLVKTGFQIPDPNAYFTQIETILRRSLGVEQNAKAEVDLKPAPPIETGPVKPQEEDQAGMGAFGGAGGASGFNPDDFGDWAEMKKKLETEQGIDFDTPPSQFSAKHDEL